MKIRFAVTAPAAALHEDHFDAYLEECETLGFDTIWLSDVPLGPLGDPLLSLTYAAARTTRLKLGMNVVPLGRNPMWLAKQLAQLDRLSRGRLLVSLVPGLGQPQERAALGHPTGDRGRAIDQTIELLRAWWSGDAVDDANGQFEFAGVKVLPTPFQTPLEIWLGGIGPAALDRVARLADGWLTANATPGEAAAGRRKIEARAKEFGRTVDSEHFGISMPFSISDPDPSVVAALAARRGSSELSEIAPVGGPALARLLRAHIDGGLSKFVLRPVTSTFPTDWRRELRWLADIVLPLQT
jgi:probable F420-dependent oxidoreductase